MDNENIPAKRALGCMVSFEIWDKLAALSVETRIVKVKLVEEAIELLVEKYNKPCKPGYVRRPGIQ